MNTRIIALLAVCIMMTSSLAHAFEVKLYGQGNLSMDSVDDGEESSLLVTSSSSRLGITGNHNVNSDLKVIFQFETGVDITSQGGNDGNGPTDPADGGQLFTKGRPSFVGLSGGFGKVLIGHTPGLDQWANDYNLFADHVGDLGNLWEAAGLPGRVDNVLHYGSPTFMDALDFALTYKPEEFDEDSQGLIFKGNLNHALGTGKVKLGFAYATFGQGADADDHVGVAVLASYHADKFSVGGGVQNETDAGGVEGLDLDHIYFGGSVNISDKVTLKAQYALTEVDADDADASQIAVGIDFMLDKHTTLFANYAQVDNDAEVAFAVNGKGHGDKVVPAFGDDPTALSVGIIYQFDVGYSK
ncbi:MAG: porin [Gammaproteobacteria bacterium]|nr:MAG: porin [Gammaproteobacteria bacterium]